MLAVQPTCQSHCELTGHFERRAGAAAAAVMMVVEGAGGKHAGHMEKTMKQSN